MSQRNEGWEWTKYVLTRSLFEDMPRSNFSEEESSSDDSCKDSSYYSPLPLSFYEYEHSKEGSELETPRRAISGKQSSSNEAEDPAPYSPLPPSLIIELEPNKHDESEEFYKQLEIKMKEYYRILFFGDNSEDNPQSVEPQYKDVNESDSIPEFGYGSPLQLTYICDDEESCSDEESDDDNCIELNPEDIEMNKYPSNITRAEIHRVASDIDISRSLIYEDSVKSPIIEPTSLEKITHVEDIGGAALEESIRPDNEPECIEDIEVMRGTDKHQSQELDLSEKSARDIRLSDAAINEGLAEDFHLNVQMEVIDEIESQNHFDDNIQNSSTPKLSSRKRKSSQDDPIVTKKKKYLNTSTQTAIEDDTINPHAAWDILRSNFFVGIPRIFNLCSCKNHVCAR